MFFWLDTLIKTSNSILLNEHYFHNLNLCPVIVDHYISNVLEVAIIFQAIFISLSFFWLKLSNLCGFKQVLKDTLLQGSRNVIQLMQVLKSVEPLIQ